MVKRCCICKLERRSDDPDISLHNIPVSNDLRIKWFDAIGREVSKNSAVCNMHFEEKDFVYKIISGKIKIFLLPGVAPTKDCHYYSENINRLMTSWRNCSLISESQSTLQVESSHQQPSDSCINCIEAIHENNTIAIQPSLKRKNSDGECLTPERNIRNRRYLGDLKREDFTSDNSYNIFNNQTNKYRKKIKILHQKVKILNKKVNNLQSLLEHLRENGLITEDGCIALEVSSYVVHN